jgi:flagellar basal body rod protein FlgG
VQLANQTKAILYQRFSPPRIVIGGQKLVAARVNDKVLAIAGGHRRSLIGSFSRSLNHLRDVARSASRVPLNLRMDPISITAASGMRARMESLDMLANNLANASTGGYKTDREFFGLYVSQDAQDLDEAGLAGSPDQLPVIEKQYTDYSQGTIRTTDNPLDFALSGRGFFAVNGPTGPLYTRNGSFKLTPAGLLVTGDGMPLRSKSGGTIQTRSTSNLEVSGDGTVIQDGQVLGQLDIVTFDEPRQLGKQGLNYFHQVDPKDTPAPSDSQVFQGKLEGSNVGSAESSVRLISVLRQFEMLSKAINIGSDMDKQALQEVAKVNS